MELYHVFNRGVEKRTIFIDDSDRARFVHDLYEFNDVRPAPDTYRTMWEIRSPTLNRLRETIVDIHGWVQMGNHYHLLLSERKAGGLSKFLRKLNVGYAMYFNEKHERSGVLFQGRTKKVLIERDAHFLYILHYIHLNPLDLTKEHAAWRDGKLANQKAALEYLNAYRWSSFLDYSGTKNFPSVIETGLFSDVFRNYSRTLASYMRDIELEPVRSLLLE
jgi:putative transposase